MPEELLGLFPLALQRAVIAACAGEKEAPAEIRLRLGHFASLAFYRGGRLQNVPLPVALDGEGMRRVFSGLCRGSVYAYEDSVKEGYVSLPGGLRVGVGGVCVSDGEKIRAVREVTSLVFRIPRPVLGCAASLIRLFRERRCGILVYAPPGGGKTTLLREAARELSRAPFALRVAVIDTRGEFTGLEEECLVDVLSGYPKAKGLEIAVRTLSPDLLICDEITDREAEGIFAAAGSGVPLLASAHGRSEAEVKARPGLAPFFRAGIFPILQKGWVG